MKFLKRGGLVTLCISVFVLYSPLDVFAVRGYMVAQSNGNGVTAIEPEMMTSPALDIPAGQTEEKKGVSNWVWIGLGVVLVGVAAAAAGGGGGGGGGNPDTGTVTVGW